MNRWILSLICTLACMSSFGQRTAGLFIHLVTKDDQKRIVGASVSSVNENVVTQTDGEGKSHINNITYPISLCFSHIGFNSKVVQFDHAGSYTVQLEVSAQELEEAVVQTGYQAIPKERATGSFSFLKN